MNSLQDEGKAYQEWDEDADVDESGELFQPPNGVNPSQSVFVRSTSKGLIQGKCIA